MKTFFNTIIMLTIFISPAYGAGSETIESKDSNDASYYNKGVEKMLEKDFPSAEKWFRKALNDKERFAEAHNNLAYVLRKHGPDYYEESLKHYNRAIELKPDLAQPYMYRGVLYVQMGEIELAKRDHIKLKDLDI